MRRRSRERKSSPFQFLEPRGEAASKAPSWPRTSVGRMTDGGDVPFVHLVLFFTILVPPCEAQEPRLEQRLRAAHTPDVSHEVVLFHVGLAHKWSVTAARVRAHCPATTTIAVFTIAGIFKLRP